MEVPSHIIIGCCFILSCAPIAATQEGQTTATQLNNQDVINRVAEPAKIITTTEDPEHGQLSEIRNAHQVYIYSTDLEARNLITKELAKDNHLQVVDSKKEAEFLILYRKPNLQEASRILPTLPSGEMKAGEPMVIANGRPVLLARIKVGEFIVITNGHVDAQHHWHVRILWQTQKYQEIKDGITLTNHPAVNATRDFLKNLKKVRNAK